jgi:hypothetical protein
VLISRRKLLAILGTAGLELAHGGLLRSRGLLRSGGLLRSRGIGANVLLALSAKTVHALLALCGVGGKLLAACLSTDLEAGFNRVNLGRLLTVFHKDGSASSASRSDAAGAVLLGSGKLLAVLSTAGLDLAHGGNGGGNGLGSLLGRGGLHVANVFLTLSAESVEALLHLGCLLLAAFASTGLETSVYTVHGSGVFAVLDKSASASLASRGDARGAVFLGGGKSVARLGGSGLQLARGRGSGCFGLRSILRGGLGSRFSFLRAVGAGTAIGNMRDLLAIHGEESITSVNVREQRIAGSGLDEGKLSGTGGDSLVIVVLSEDGKAVQSALILGLAKNFLRAEEFVGAGNSQQGNSQQEHDASHFGTIKV